MAVFYGRELNPEELPDIETTDRAMRDVTESSWDALTRVNDPEPHLFTMGGMVTEVIDQENGRATANTVKENAFKLILDNVANFGTSGKLKGRKPTRPPIDVVRAMLDSHNRRLPELNGLSGAPVFAKDGRLRTAPGYDPGTKLYLHSVMEAMPPVPDDPSYDELTSALDLLQEDLLGDFPFASHADRANALALLLLPFVRPMIPGPTPPHMISSPVAGTGKGLLAQALILPALGETKAVMTEGGTDDEWRKRITATLRSGPSVILIDNVCHKLDSSALSAALTGLTWQDRILGVSKIVNLPNRAVWIATGNNPTFSQELGRRIVPIRLDSKVENPWEREDFRHPDLIAWATKNRSRLVWAALTICNFVKIFGWPDGSKSMGSYERYARLMSGILEVVGVEGFLENRDQVQDVVEDDTAVWIRFLIQWWNEHEDQPVRAIQLLTLADRLSLLLGITSGRNHRGKVTALGRALTSNRDRIFGRYSICLVGQDGHTKSNMFALREVG